MKKILSLALAALLLASALFTLASCSSSYGSIERRFKKEGYTVVDTSDSEGKNYLSFTSSLNKGEISGTVHVLKGGAVLNNTRAYAVIVEFGADKDAQDAMQKYLEDEDVKILLKNVQQEDCVNGNCILIPVMVSTNKEVLNTMIKTFKGK